jgi:hypothetical protein
MSPKAGTSVSLVAPATPVEARSADSSTAGKVETISSTAAKTSAKATSSTKVGAATANDGGASSASASSASAPASPAPPVDPHKPDPAKKGWIEIILKDEEGAPQGGTRYRVTLPNGALAEGTLDAKGHARVDGFDSGPCKVTFPELDEKTWKEK